jgi:hypothetical protein
VFTSSKTLHRIILIPKFGPGSKSSATADKGYHAVEEMKELQAQGIRTVISDPVRNRRIENLTPQEAKVVANAKRSAGRKSGKELLRRRGMHLERSLAHVLDAGGARRTTLRGLENLNKRFKVSAAIYNLSQLMRKLFGVGTPKQWAAMGKALFLFLRTVLVSVCALPDMDRTNPEVRPGSTSDRIWLILKRVLPESPGWNLLIETIVGIGDLRPQACPS